MSCRTTISQACLFALLLLCNSLHAQDIKTDTSYDFVIRLGEGGFRDNRSPENALGGGQFTLDIIPHSLPLALSFSGENYTNSPEPTHRYEIKDMLCVNLLYYSPANEINRFRYFIGGGSGRLKVPNDLGTEVNYTSNLLNLEAGFNYLAFSHVGFYAVAKYLYASDREDNVHVIDFNEAIILIGVTFNFSL